MSEGTVSASYGEHSENVEDLVRALPAWMPKDHDSRNFDLLDVIGRAFDRLDEDIRDTDKAATLQEAQSVEEVEVIATTVGLRPETNESLESYRTRVLGEFQSLTGEGTIPDLLRNAAVLLGVDVSDVGYTQTDPGVGILSAPFSAVKALALPDTEFANIISRQMAAGYRMEVTKSGTFTYLAETAYSGPYDSANGGYDPTALASDSTLGYDGLDTNGNPKNNGGTYAGVLE